MEQSQKFELQLPRRQEHSPFNEQSAWEATWPPQPSGAVPLH
jgi:hypothetical protein